MEIHYNGILHEYILRQFLIRLHYVTNLDLVHEIKTNDGYDINRRITCSTTGKSIRFLDTDRQT